MNCDYEIGIVGTGFSGIIAAIELLDSGRNSFCLFEKSASIGGVWRDNIYPGCACDIRASLYSLKKEPNPNWSSSYPKQEEILNYLLSLVKKYQLEKYIKYHTPIEKMTFDEGKGCWQLNSNEDVFHVKLAIMATGPQRLPRLPSIKGIETFQGKSFHSSAWDYSVDMSHMNVAVIGTGASSIQIIPRIAKTVKNLFVFQRTPAWVMPRWDKKNSGFTKWIYKNVPAVQKVERELNFWFLEFIGTSFFWNKILRTMLTNIAKLKIRLEVGDSSIVKKLTPEYMLGCKRILVSDDYYPAFKLPNVHLITDRIVEISQNSVHTLQKEFPVDMIIYATGFTVSDVENYIEITGLGGKVLNDAWDITGAEAYLGINVSGYPNLCFLLGPNSGLSHSSTIHVMESQMNYIMQYLSFLEKETPQAYLNVLEEKQKNYNEKLQGNLKTRSGIPDVQAGF